MITTVTLNPAIDKSVILGEIRVGEVQIIKEVIQTVGGKGINVSKVLNLFGVESFATGILGKDNANLFKNYLDVKGIKHNFYEVSGITRTNIKIIETQKQRTTDLNEKGIHIETSDFRNIYEKLYELSKKSEYVIVSGSVPSGISENDFSRLIRKMSKSSNVVVDTSGKKLTLAVEAGASIIKPNIDEIKDAYDVCFDSERDYIDFCRSLIATTDLTVILLTLGSKGAYYITEDEVLHGMVPSIKPLNTVGAGDSFLGGYLAGICLGKSNLESFKMAVASGTTAVSVKSTDVFTQKDYCKNYEKVSIKKIPFNVDIETNHCS